MSINRSSDSLSRCDPNLYSNPYDLRKRSDIKHNPVFATQPTHKDTIEISRDKLKEEALNRLRHTSKYVIAQNSFMRVGKYLFLAVAFPPYLLVYGLPKWILAQGFPAIYSLTFWMGGKVNEKILKPINNKINTTIQKMKNMVRVFIQPIARLTLDFRHKINRLKEQAYQWLNDPIKNIKLRFDKPKKFIINQIKNVRKQLSQFKGKIEEKSTILFSQLKENFIESLKQSPQIILSWGQTWLLKLKQSLISKNSLWQTKFKTSQIVAQKTTCAISKGLTTCLKYLKKLAAPGTTFYQRHMRLQLQKMREICKNSWIKAHDFFKQKHQKALSFLHTSQKKLKALNYLNLVDQLLAKDWFKGLPSNLQRLLRKWIHQPISVSIGEKMIKTFSFCSGLLLNVLAKLLFLLSFLTSWTQKAYVFCKGLFKLFEQRVLKGCKIAYAVSKKFVMQVIYYFLLLTVMAGILVWWAFQILGEAMQSLSQSFSLSKFLPSLHFNYTKK